MICLSSTTIMILMDDGSKIRFDTETLQTRLIKCCLIAGVKEFWIAEDLTNAVESALTYQSEKGILFTEKEINVLILKMLEESGNHEIGAAFRTTFSNKSRDINMSEENSIRKSIEKGLTLSNEELYNITNKVHSACKELNIINASENLLLELARYYRSQNKELPKISNIVLTLKNNSKWIVSKTEIFDKLSTTTQNLIRSEMIDISGLGILFPSIKLEFKFTSLANYFNIEGLITELQLFPCFPLAVDAINEIISVIKENLPKFQPELKVADLPIYLKFTDIYFFAEKYFGIKLSTGEKFCRELAGTFAESLQYGVQIKIVKI